MAKPKTLGRTKRTSRGFELVQFKDHYGSECSLQASSLAVYTRPGVSAVWLGIDRKNPELTKGIPPPENVRMHLSRKQVEALVNHLQSWLTNFTFRP